MHLISLSSTVFFTHWPVFSYTSESCPFRFLYQSIKADVPKQIVHVRLSETVFLVALLICNVIQMYLATDSTSSKVLDGPYIWWYSLLTTWLNAKLSLNIHHLYTELSLIGNTVCIPLASCIKCIINLYKQFYIKLCHYTYQLFFFPELYYCNIVDILYEMFGAQIWKR